MSKVKQFYLLIFLIPVSLLNFCCQTSTKKNIIPSDSEIFNADISFSDMSRQVGMKKAFLQYMDNEGALLRPDHLPLVGADAVDFLSALNDTGFTLSWKPLKARVAQSAEIGYTYGIYELKLSDTIIKGTYITVWKKESNGEWKFLVNSNNPGLSESSDP